MIVELSAAKAHLNITGDDDDALIAAKISAAESHLNRLLGFKVAVEFAADGIPADLKEAALQLVAHMFENREAVLVGVNAQMLPFGVHDIVREYRNWSF